ncbi:hypothetical protein F53441_14550 [Fusarium austroafricanum]|uniref:non-specific serine/threonine protein kinase n=1 Tax=Fusarium austroafricanum TaxID=2364996 RepID=A0A8H4N9E6_9HYPO|nr:hypothetical protein F53441_14550 [Fusarium austroafricanum]
MEYFPEGDLFTYVRDRQGLPEDECREITSQIVSGIALMHAERFAHRDVKPKNILIHRNPRDGLSRKWRIKLGDFGICKRFGNDTNTTNLAMGTEQYMAPELLTPDQMSHSARDYQKPDIWALGVTVLFILTNTVPFSSPSLTKEFARNLGEPFPYAPLRDRNVSEGGQAFVRDTIKPKPESRMNSATAMQHVWIKAFLPDCPVSGTYMRTSTITSLRSSSDDTGGLTNEISTLASQLTLSDYLSSPPRDRSDPRPVEFPMQILHGDNNPTIDIVPVRGLAASLEEYWGSLVTPYKAPSSTFSNLICSIFNHFNNSNTGMLQPHELCAFMHAARWLPQQFPPIQVLLSDSPPTLSALQQCDDYITNCYRWYPLDHRMGTREIASSVPIQPHAGRIRVRDQFMLGLARLLAPAVPDGMPLLTRRGFEQYLMFMALGSPDDLFVRLNHILGTMTPHLKDPRTDRPFEAHIPRSCFPPAPSSGEQQMRVMMETRAALWQAENTAR